MLTEDLIRAKAKRFCELENIPEAERPKWSHGWIAKFKQHTGLRQRRFYGESNSVQLAEHVDRIDEINATCDDYSEDDRYNFDEIGLFYRMPPSIGLATQEAHGSKGDKTRLTFGFCVNASGTDKREPLIIGHARRPRCFGKRPASHLGYNFYYNNKKAWMTGAIWLDWLQKFDKEMERQNRQVILLVDNCSSHLEPEFDLKATRLEFLPPNTTAQLQPLDAGIIRTFKAYYRRQFLQLAILKDEENISANPFKISQLDAMEMAKGAWNLITPSTIENCWKHVGLANMFGPGLPVERLSDPFPTIGPSADLYQQRQEFLLQHPDQLFLAPDCQEEVC